MNLIFPLLNATSNPITGSLVTLRLYSSTSSNSTFPVYNYSDNNGTASFSNVNSGIYKLTWTNANANNPSNYINLGNQLVYLNIPSSSITDNGFNYLYTGSLNGNSSSLYEGNPSDFNTDLSSLTNYIKSYLTDWAIQEGGNCFLGEDDHEKIRMGFNNCVGPRVLLVYLNDAPYGDELVAEVTGRIKRDYDVVIQRGKTLTGDRNFNLSNVNGASKPFYTLVEEVRDVMRAIGLPTPMCYNPIIFNGCRPLKEEDWMMDSYVMNFSIIMTIPRVQYQPPQLSGNGPYVDLGPQDWLSNTTP